MENNNNNWNNYSKSNNDNNYKSNAKTSSPKNEFNTEEYITISQRLAIDLLSFGFKIYDENNKQIDAIYLNTINDDNYKYKTTIAEFKSLINSNHPKIKSLSNQIEIYCLENQLQETDKENTYVFNAGEEMLNKIFNRINKLDVTCTFAQYNESCIVEITVNGNKDETQMNVILNRENSQMKRKVPLSEAEKSEIHDTVEAFNKAKLDLKKEKKLGNMSPEIEKNKEENIHNIPVELVMSTNFDNEDNETQTKPMEMER